jgi:hypothetical protein
MAGTRDEIDVEFLDPQRMRVILTDGTTLPITNLFDADGEDTDDYEEAWTLVAGTDEAGWYTIAIDRDSLVRHTFH